MTQTIRSEQPSGAIPPDAFVLQNRELRDGVVLSITSRFADEIWVLPPAVHQVQQHKHIIHFSAPSK